MTSESSEVSRLDGVKPDDAAELVWHTLRDFAKEQGPNGTADLFKRFDTDGSGVLDPKEFKAALATVGLPGASNKVVESVMKTAASGEGAKGSKKKLDLSTFARALNAPEEGATAEAAASADEGAAGTDAEIPDDASFEEKVSESENLFGAVNKASTQLLVGEKAVADAVPVIVVEVRPSTSTKANGPYRTLSGFSGSLQECLEHETSEGSYM